ncbi:MAG: Gfo/Idh/MocA family oxidoreductase [Rubricoccaceae bacterium]|nr:Gfo/Idh/MocA family oxidoreductase [Rubricoccaceae bacterium]
MDGNGHSGTRGPLRVGLVGAGRRGAARARALVALPGVTLGGVADADAGRARALAHGHGAPAFPSVPALLAVVDAVCVCVPPADRFRVARVAAGGGVHVFLDWPPATGPAEAEQLGHLAEEAGVEVGVARPLPIRTLLDAGPPDWRPRLFALTLDAGTAPDDALGALPWPHRLAGALDLAVGFAQKGEVQRIEAEADREGARLCTVAFGLRFRNGLYAQTTLHERARAVPPPDRFRLDAAGGGLHLSARALDGPVCLESDSVRLPNPSLTPTDRQASPPAVATPANELDDFLNAIAAGQPAPVSVLDALHTLRLVERLMERLR